MDLDDITVMGAVVCLYTQRRRRRRVWVHEILRRHEELGGFHRLVLELRLDRERFQRYFRLDIQQFDSLLMKIGPLIAMQSTNYSRPISPSERLAICLRFLATGDSYRTIANSYRVAVRKLDFVKSKVSKVFVNVSMMFILELSRMPVFGF